MSGNPHVAVVGATGAVGVEMLRTLEARDFPVGELTLLASARSAGKQMTFRGQPFTVKELTKDAFQDIDIALFSAGGSISKEFAPAAAERGCVVIDNSSAFRMEPDTPLVIPEINPEAAHTHRGIIANPNCSTIVTLMALAPLHRRFGLKRFIASTYQAVSGSGAGGIRELDHQIDSLSKGAPVATEVYPKQIAFNALPHVDVFLEGGYTKEEMKMLNEGRKILGLPDLVVTCTCVRIPVYRAHSVSVSAAFENAVDLEEARRAIEAFPGVRLNDAPEEGVYPTPLEIAGQDDCAVGRLRKDMVFDNGLAFWVVGDQLLKGAALNAVQIAEVLVHKQTASSS